MIRLATEQDLPLVGSIYEEILAEEEKRPASFTNWQRGKYPTVEHARAALEAGTCMWRRRTERCTAAST